MPTPTPTPTVTSAATPTLAATATSAATPTATPTVAATAGALGLLGHRGRLRKKEAAALGRYLDLLQRQEAALRQDDTTAALAYSEEGGLLVDRLGGIQKALDAAGAALGEAALGETAPDEDAAVEERAALLRHIQAQTEQNRSLLRTQIPVLQGQLDALRRLEGQRSVFAAEGRASRIAVDA
jgi:hypothetical protein